MSFFPLDLTPLVHFHSSFVQKEQQITHCSWLFTRFGQKKWCYNQRVQIKMFRIPSLDGGTVVLTYNYK